MGQRANSGRNASLDDKKSRMAGRDDRSPTVEAIHDYQKPLPAKGKADGAFGKSGKANRKGGSFTQGGGGGGGAPAPAEANHLNVGTKKK